MRLDDFLTCIRDGEIPPESPDKLRASGYGRISLPDLSYWTARRECAEHGMWAIVAQDWTQLLANWIDDRQCLEIMAGRAWLARALYQHGVKLVATDNDSAWDNRHTKGKSVFSVHNLEASDAVLQFGASSDILIVSWPPYGEKAICDACELWESQSSNRPIVYIGEGDGGCNAPDEFWQRFQEYDDVPDIPLMSWPGLHDHISIGQWSTRRPK